MRAKRSAIHPNETRPVEIMKLDANFSLLPIGHKCFAQYPVPEHTPLCFSPSVGDQFHTHIIDRIIEMSILVFTAGRQTIRDKTVASVWS
jgi:hypothetical protein